MGEPLTPSSSQLSFNLGDRLLQPWGVNPPYKATINYLVLVGVTSEFGKNRTLRVCKRLQQTDLTSFIASSWGLRSGREDSCQCQCLGLLCIPRCSHLSERESVTRFSPATRGASPSQKPSQKLRERQVDKLLIKPVGGHKSLDGLSHYLAVSESRLSEAVNCL